MRIENRGNHFEISVAIEEDHSLPSLEDAYLSLEFSSHGFSGANELWVTSPALVAFCCQLLELARKQEGEALLESRLPGELRLRVYATSPGGPLAIEGDTGYTVDTPHGGFWHEARFGFEFEPWQLVTAIRQPWIQAHAAWAAMASTSAA
ncbi:MAG TPA: hypothetical protein VFM34_07615, partial [Moraxellaceae bacterium]|nr:hypothetical protein [Moraxellaceae bacterium]